MTGSGGTTSYTYDNAGQLIRRSDPTGTATFSWTPRGQLAVATDPLKNTTRTYAYDAAGQLKVESNGDNNAQRSFTYDGLGRMIDDTTRTAAGTATAGYHISYDPNGNITAEDGHPSWQFCKRHPALLL